MMRRRGGWLYRLMVRGVAWWCAAHGLTVVDGECLEDAVRATMALAQYRQRSGHLTRRFKAGKAVDHWCGWVAERLAKAQAVRW